jgi:hypothetical protein
MVAPSLSLTRQVARINQLAHDAVGGSFGDPKAQTDIAKAHAAIVGDADEDLSVIGQKAPYVFSIIGHGLQINITRLSFHDMVIMRF